MISQKIIQIASNTKFSGLNNNFTHKSSVKNSFCGDKIKIELIIDKKKINSMRYEVESCVLCEASASLLATKIKNLNIATIIKELSLLKKIVKDEKHNFPYNFKDFKVLINKNNLSRINCINLPFDAVMRALRL